MPATIPCTQCGRQFNVAFPRCPFCNHPAKAAPAPPATPPPLPRPLPPPLPPRPGPGATAGPPPLGEPRRAEPPAKLTEWAGSGREILAAARIRTEGGTATLITALDRYLDELLARGREHVPQRELGAFLGELLCSRYGGKWRGAAAEAAVEAWQVAWPSGTCAAPFAMLTARLQPGGKALLAQMAALESTLSAQGDATIPAENPADWLAQADAYGAKPPRLDLAILFASVALQSGGDSPAARLKLARWCQELGKMPAAKAHLDNALKLDPSQPALWLERAKVHFALRELDAAAADAGRCLELDPLEALAHLIRGSSLLAAGQPAAALADFESAVELAPQRAECLLGRAGALLTLGRPREALEWTDAFAGRPEAEPARTRLAALAAEQSGEVLRAWELYGRLREDARLPQNERDQAAARWLALGDTKEVLLGMASQLDVEPAIAAYARVSEKFPELAEPWRERGVGLAMLGRTDEALACFDHAIALNPADAIAHDHKAVVFGRSKRFEEALAVLQEGLRTCPHSGRLWCRRGIFLSLSGQPAEADRAFDRCAEVDPGHEEMWAYKGDLAAQQGRTEEAIRALSRLVAARRGSRQKVVDVARRQLWSLQHPGSVVDTAGASADQDAAQARFLANDFAGALARLNEAVAKDPFAADAWVNRGAMLRQLGQLEEALQSYEAAEDLGESGGLAARGAAACLEQLGRGAEAVQRLDRALAQAKHPDPQLLRAKAQLLGRLGRATESLPIYERLVARGPADAALLRERGQALGAAGRSHAAAAAFRAAEALSAPAGGT